MRNIQGLRKEGSAVWFEYHCLESETSQDAELWHHSHQKVTILRIAQNDGMDIPTRKERDEAGQPIVYTIRFADGFEADAAEDELVDRRTEFERPNPPLKEE